MIKRKRPEDELSERAWRLEFRQIAEDSFELVRLLSGTEAPHRVFSRIVASLRRVTLRNPLTWFRWFLPKETREDIDFALGDIREDTREMLSEGESRWFIHTIALWHSLRCIAPFLIDGVWRLLRAILPSFQLLKKYRSSD